MSNMKERIRPWKEGERGTGQVQESCEEFCYGFTTHSKFFLFSGHSISPLLAHWCTLIAAELRAII